MYISRSLRVSIIFYFFLQLLGATTRKSTLSWEHYECLVTPLIRKKLKNRTEFRLWWRKRSLGIVDQVWRGHRTIEMKILVRIIGWQYYRESRETLKTILCRHFYLERCSLILYLYRVFRRYYLVGWAKIKKVVLAVWIVQSLYIIQIYITYI